MLPHETNSSDLEEAWPIFGVKLEDFCGQLSSTEVRVFEAIVHAAADEAKASDETLRLPQDLTENTQPQRDGISLLLAGAIAHLPHLVFAIGAARGSPPERSGGNLVKTVAQKFATLPTSEAESQIAQILLGLAASNLVRGSGKLSVRTDALVAYTVAMDGLRLLQPHHERIPLDGKVWCGSPTFFTGHTLGELQADAAEARQRAVELKWRSLAHAGRAATQLARSQPLLDLVQTHVGRCAPTGRAAYVYFDAPGQGLYPHVDTSKYALTALFAVRHDYGGAPRSTHLHYRADGSAERVDLKPGELLLFFGGSVVHGRTPVAQDEAVAVLTIGFRLLR
jgi:hypothetical protein